MMTDFLPMREARRRTEADRRLLASRVENRPERELVAPYRVEGGPLGDFCDSLRDLVAHVLMWDEINLAVLTEARLGRAHWSLDGPWETPSSGRALNLAGVMAGRELPVDLLLHRFGVVRDALVDELSRYDEDRWTAPLALSHPRATSTGALAQYVMSIPNGGPYWHAAIHLGEQAVMNEQELV
ncbi:hypothetical protein [Actinomadura rugatobispora]|uniref:DinB family protein n=1 Tax=Actinomadura rugatobispora TaxID=1994 RepID=A0ABW0ZXU7_9ACTN|nr:hypothetical protein GCM10010200_090660 [Actinomadura rugatobispora]